MWKEMPEIIHVPPASGLVNLSIHQKVVESPLLDSEGRLWLQKRKDTRLQEERVAVRVYRLLNDTVPMQITNHLKVNVSGRTRKLKIEGVLLERFFPLRIKSPLPARLGPRGELLLQIRPGRWEIQILSRSKEPVHSVESVHTSYGEEIWSFQSQNHLRMVKIQGVPPIDPTQTDIPKA